MVDEINSKIPELPGKEEIQEMYSKSCEKLGILDIKDNIKDLVIYELTDGTRTSLDTHDWKAYVDGGFFIMKLVHSLNSLGCKNFYVLTTGRNHRARDNYKEIIYALTNEVDVYRKFSMDNNIRMKFIGDIENLQYNGSDKFRSALQALEEETSKNTGLTMWVLIDYSSDWAHGRDDFKSLPPANVILKHTKGQVNEGLWLPGKLHGNSFVYAQNASVGSKWSYRDIVHLISISLRSMNFHKGRQYSKSYSPEEIEEIKKRREESLEMVHKQLESPFSKRVVMFSHVGPEIYEF
jgi:hypothetical protein